MERSGALGGGGRSTKYEVVPAPAAIRTILGLSDPERKELADALRTELLDGPNADKEARFDADMRPCGQACGPHDVVYTGTPLSFGAYVAVHRPMTKEELERLRRNRAASLPGRGFYVLDILPPAPHSRAGRGSLGTSSRTRPEWGYWQGCSSPGSRRVAVALCAGLCWAAECPVEVTAAAGFGGLAA